MARLVLDEPKKKPRLVPDKFDPEGSGYDMDSALRYGLKPTMGEDGKPHGQSRIPQTGLLLKGKQHKTWDLLEKGEEEAGMEIYKGEDGRYYSRPQKKKPRLILDESEVLFMPPSFDAPTIADPQDLIAPTFKPPEIQQPILEERPQTIGVHPPPTAGQKVKRFFVGEPKYGRWTKPQRLDYLHRVLDVPLSIITKFASGRTLGADKLSWYVLSKIRPDLADKPLEEQMAELSPYEKSGFQKMAGGLAEFIGQIQSSSKLLGKIGWKAPKGKRVIDRIARNAPPWMTSGAIDSLVEGVIEEKGATQIAKEVAASAAIRGGEAVVFSGLEWGAGKLFQSILKRFPRFGKGWQKWREGRKPAEVRTARREVDEALRNYKETGDRTAWDNVRIKYAGIKPEGVAKIRARQAPPEVKEFGKYPLARQAKPPVRVAPVPTQPTPVVKPTTPEQISPRKAEITPPVEAVKPEIAPKPLLPKEVTAKKGKYTELAAQRGAYQKYKENVPDATEQEIIRFMVEDGLRPPKAVLERNSEMLEVQEIFAQDKTEAVAKAAEKPIPSPVEKAKKGDLEKPPAVDKTVEKAPEVTPSVETIKQEVGFVEKEPTTGEKFFHKAATQAQKEKALAIAKKKAFISEKGKPRPGYRALAKAMTGETSIDKMTEQQAEDFINALNKLPEPTMRGGKLIPPSIPRTTALVPKGFFQRRFKRPTPASLITSQTYYAEKLGVKSLVEPLEKAKMSFDLEYRKAANELDKMGKAIDKLGKTTAKERVAAKIKNIPTKARMEIGDLLDQYEDAPANLDPKKKEIFNWFRNLTRTILTRQNESRAKLGVPPIKGRKAYMRHIATDISREMLSGKYPFPEGIGFWSQLRMGKKIFNPMEFQRKLEEDVYGLFSRDPVYASKAMMYTALKEIHLNQPLKFFNEQLNALGKDLPEYKNLSPREKAELSKMMVIPADTRRWLTDYVNTVIKGRQTNADRLVNNIVNESGLKGLLNIVLRPFGRTLSRKPITGFFQKAGRMQMAGVMGPRPRLLIRNKFQLTQNLALYGTKANVRAFLPPNKELKKLLDESLFLKSYTGLEELPPDLAKKVEKLWHKAYQWTATSNARQAMEVAYWDTKELIDNPKYKKYGWKPEHLLKEMEFGAAATQYQYNAIGMPGIFRHKSLIPVTRLTSWWMNYFAKFHREGLHRAFTGRPSWTEPEGPTLPWSRRLGWLRYAIIGGLILNTMGYERSYMFGAAPTGWPPAMQAASSLYRYVIADDDKKREAAKKRFYNAVKTFIPGSIAYKDFEAFWTGRKNLSELLFYKKKKKKEATE